MIEIDVQGRKAYLNEYSIKKEIKNFESLIILDENLTFIKDDYKYFFEQAIYGPVKDSAILTDNCDVEIDGFVLHGEGKYNMLECVAKKKINFESALNFKERYNIFDYDVSDLTFLEGNLQRFDYTYKVNGLLDPVLTYESLSSIVAGIPDESTDGFFPEYIELKAIPVGLIPSANILLIPSQVIYNIELLVTYYRLKSATQISGWVEFLGGFYFPFKKKAITRNVIYRNVGEPFFIPYIAEEVNYTSGKPFSIKDDKKISNARSLNVMLLDLFQGKNYISNFFGINPDATQPENEEYKYSFDYLQELKIFQSYDIIRSDAAVDSFGISGIFEFEKMIKDINQMFNLVTIYEKSTNTVRHEHVSYFRTKGVELTDYEFDEVDTNVLGVKKETWQMAGESSNLGHYKTDIVYENVGDKEDIYKMDLLLTDVEDMLENEKYNDVNKYGRLFFLCATRNDKLIGLNYVLQISELVKVFHKTGRPYRFGKQDGESINFVNTSLGMTTKISFYNSLKGFMKLNIFNAIKVKEGIFYITGIQIDQNGKIEVEVNK